ncbi:16S rRNA (adenine(1518)-N(6)/adenine(1519)-N(6))-dimethyltransferase RsmA [Segnochrobactrum spirostomi]|uniref:Ribosomal RNA small subunit methyltransferase A n=1 Tax=Segnochrobactrum spirostomi TaxID=2608987 RepID=A0A6A7Y1M9_9HYPH|nr:16S rRNA (adenine(1518)-N(6)/adenine(1519)-N(6))-dimethyltransferase RsmA [Segnochrobactrum spirostomi]MQT11722.1 16S rRNA (adenine(1518)-N(6)/adenine(1519)-N(6))-dimethyltransferase RsmA [Segnochrobactrum spirostomi]
MAQADDLPPLREVIATHGLAARKSLGQNFLLDLNLTGRIARAAEVEDRVVVEVGPGPGGLTRALLTAGARRVIAIERDERCLPALAEIADHYPGRLQVISGDALAVDFPALVGGEPAQIVANLPYNVGTALLVGWLESEPWPPWWRSLTLMFQREVAERIVAPPGSEAYGRLGVIAGWRTEAKILFDISPAAFTPPPKVTSSVVRLIPRTTLLPCAAADLSRVTAAAFGQRRKMLRSSLKSLGGDTAALIEAAGLDPTARAETVPIEGFAALARAVAAMKAGTAP